MDFEFPLLVYWMYLYNSPVYEIPKIVQQF